MNIFYYRDFNSGLCPVKEYLRKFTGKDKLLADLDGKIRSIARKGVVSPPLAKPLQNYSISEIMKSFRDIEIRLLCAPVSNEFILFHAFDKPMHYENIKKINRQIEKNYNKAEGYYNIFKNEKDNEKYKEEYK
jgi:hypothetical protein